MNKWIDKCLDECGEPNEFGNYEVIDDKLTLNCDGFACLTDDIEEILEKYTGSEEWINNIDHFEARSKIRHDLMDLIHSIVNKEDKHASAN